MDTGRHVDWAASREEFERVVEALVQRKWSLRDDGDAYVVDGRGGDEGLDIFVKRDGNIVHVYQLKFFPEGMSGGFRQRRQQVKRSFESVADIESLEDWTLITPSNPTTAELKSTFSLRKGRPLHIHVWGRAQLDQEITRHPDLLSAATRRPVLDALREAGQESALLAGPDDLASRALKLGQLADGRSLYWGVEVTTDGNHVTQRLFPKRPDAAEMEPIAFRISGTFGAAHQPLLEEFKKFVDYGGSKGIYLPPEVVSVFETLGPEWIAGRSEGGSLTIHPHQLPEPLIAELRVISAGGALLATLPGEIRLVSHGRKGSTLQAQFLTLTITFRIPMGSKGGGAEFSYNLRGMPATAALRLLKVIAMIERGELWELHLHDRKLFGINGVNRHGGSANPLPPETYELVDDLAVLESAYDVTFPFPEQMTGEDRVDVRVARILTEGRATYSRKLGALTATIGSDADADEIRRFDEPHAITAAFPDSTFTVLGRSLPIGTLRMYHPAMKALDVEAHTAAIEDGNGEGRTLVLEPADGTPVRIWVEERWTDPTRRITPEPWSLEGVAEHSGLGLILDSAEPTVTDDEGGTERPAEPDLPGQD